MITRGKLKGRQITIILFAALLMVMTFSAVTLAAPPAFVIDKANNPVLPDVARGVPMGGTLVIESLVLDGVVPKQSLSLKRFAVFTPDARIVIDRGPGIPVPANVYFRGSVQDRPESLALVSVPEKGNVRGLIFDQDQLWVINGRVEKGRMAEIRSRRVDRESEFASHIFECGTDGLLKAENILNNTPAEGGAAPVSQGSSTALLAARVAVETDFEFFSLFGNVTDASNYIGDLFAYASTIYERETGTALMVSWQQLWTESANADPWIAQSSTGAALDELQAYWNSNSSRTSIERTVTHMLSGKGLGGGIAYVGVLCNRNYGYGVSASLAGNFSIENPAVVWDSLVVSHEIGHNFNSPHTHDYCNIKNIAAPVDQCAAGDCSAGGILPCSEGPGNACGTIMSYCHLLSGGYGNISMTFGLDHLYGVSPERVPQVMADYVAATAGIPGCYEILNPGFTLDVIKSGNGQGVVSSAPAGINCGSACSSAFEQNSLVSLSASPAVGSEFVGWSGDCSGVNGIFDINMDNDKTCNAEFASLCGNGKLDAGEVCDGALFAPGENPCGGCSGNASCTPNCTIDLSGCFDGVCEGLELGGEDCHTCAQECISGDFGGAVCGNGICEAGNGEDCVSCPTDCNGKQTGKPSGRFCCGDGDGEGPTSCADPVCDSGGFSCEDTPIASGQYCCGDGNCEGPENSDNCGADCEALPVPFCGDGTCDLDEDQCSCPGDCGIPESSETGLCLNGVDDDCDQLTDCADSDCSQSPDCTTSGAGPGEPCLVDSDCASNKCLGRKDAKFCK